MSNLDKYKKKTSKEESSFDFDDDDMDIDTYNAIRKEVFTTSISGEQGDDFDYVPEEIRDDEIVACMADFERILFNWSNQGAYLVKMLAFIWIFLPILLYYSNKEENPIVGLIGGAFYYGICLVFIWLLTTTFQNNNVGVSLLSWRRKDPWKKVVVGGFLSPIVFIVNIVHVYIGKYNILINTIGSYIYFYVDSMSVLNRLEGVKGINARTDILLEYGNYCTVGGEFSFTTYIGMCALFSIFVSFIVYFIGLFMWRPIIYEIFKLTIKGLCPSREYREEPLWGCW